MSTNDLKHGSLNSIYAGDYGKPKPEPAILEPTYLGDAVYAVDEEWQIILRLNNHQNETGQICLDDCVVNSLEKYIKRWKELHS